MLSDYANISNENKSRVFEYKNTLLDIGSLLKEIHCGQADWSEYQTLKAHSQNLGKEICKNYEDHRLYLNQLGITREKLEINIGLRQRPLSSVELDAKNRVKLYTNVSWEARKIFNKMRKEAFNVKNHFCYEKYAQIREIRNDLAKEILADFPLHREFVNFVNQETRDCFISQKSMESQVAYAEKMAAGKAKTEYGRSIINSFYAKIEAAKNVYLRKVEYTGSTVADRMILDKNDYKYEERSADHFAKFGYYPHVSKSMMFAYCGEHNLSNSTHSGSFANEYASILAHQKIETSKLDSPSLEMVEDAIKEALCFRALQIASGIRELSHENIVDLYKKAAILANSLEKENIQVINDSRLMKDALHSINTENISSLQVFAIDRIAELNRGDVAMTAQASKSQEFEQSIQKSSGMEL